MSLKPNHQSFFGLVILIEYLCVPMLDSIGDFYERDEANYQDNSSEYGKANDYLLHSNLLLHDMRTEDKAALDRYDAFRSGSESQQNQ